MKTAGRVLVFASLLALVLILAFAVAGPVIAVAIFSAVLVLSPPAPVRQPPAIAPATARRRRAAPRAPPLF